MQQWNPDLLERGLMTREEVWVWQHKARLLVILGDFVSHLLQGMHRGASAQNNTGFRKQGAGERALSRSHPNMETPSEATLTLLSSS